MPHLLLTVLPLLFFSTLPPPPRSTLFPYTTLFRSCDLHGCPRHGDRHARGLCGARSGRRDCLHQCGVGAAPTLATRDRKSTRLNSSHTVISYAVFCLKKKKHTKRPESYMGSTM